MKKYVVFSCLFILMFAACSNPIKKKLKGYWHSKDGVTKLNITEKAFAMDDGESIPEDYFIKEDTIFTSYQGNEPYTSFVVQKLDDHYLKLLGPDSVTVEFSR